MKKPKVQFVQPILVVFFILMLCSCEQENADESIQEQQTDTPTLGENIAGKSEDLRPLVSGSDFKRYYYDANGDRHTDLVAIKTRNTGTRSTEIHVIDGKSGFTKFMMQTGTALHETGSNWDFIPAPTRRGGKFGLQIYAIKKNRTDTRSTEVHVLSQNFHSFKRFVHQGGTLLHETNNTYSFKIPQGPPADNHLHGIKVYKGGSLYITLNPRNAYRD